MTGVADKPRAAELRATVAVHDRAFEDLVKSIRTHGACQCDADFLRPSADVIREIAARPAPGEVKS